MARFGRNEPATEPANGRSNLAPDERQAPAAIHLRDLVKDYPAPKGAPAGAASRALAGLDLDIPEGRFYGLLGPNGAGKSTTIHILTGLAHKTSGTAEVRGLDVAKQFKAVRRAIGLAPQEFAFDQFLSIREILTYQGMYFEMDRRAARQRADELLERFELRHKRHNVIFDLSGGQKRRLSIAKALMHDPDILILDEPTAGIDVALRHDLWRFLREQNREGKTILLTTHYIEEAQALCDHVGIIDQGRLVAEDSTEALMQRGSGDRVVVQLAAPASKRPDLPKLITKETGFVCVAADERMRLIVRDPGGASGGTIASEVLALLAKRKAKVLNIDIKRRSLEEAFVRATGAEIADDGTIIRMHKAEGANV